MLKIYVVFSILNILILIICGNSNITISNKIGSAQKELQGIDDTTTLKSIVDDAQSDLVAEFFDHVKEIFESDASNKTDNIKHNFSINKNPTTQSSTKLLRFLEITTTKRFTKVPVRYKNTTLVSEKCSTLFVPTAHNPELGVTFKISPSTRSCPKKTTTPKSNNYRRRKNRAKKTKPTTIKYFDEDDSSKDGLGPIAEDNEHNLNLMDKDISMKPRLSCIICDNVSNKDCNDPKDKLLPLVRCTRDGDMCYSMYTPFGIVDRGCYNRLLNYSTYVCSCNLCNSIPLHELPHTFTQTRDWIYNVQELSHGRRLRKSVYSQMSCIQCEVNQTIEEVPDKNCLEGKYRVLPSQYCESDEICGIRSVKSEGYIWRGCIKNPRYNYLWNFCNYDLCNFDVSPSVFDFEF